MGKEDLDLYEVVSRIEKVVDILAKRTLGRSIEQVAGDEKGETPAYGPPPKYEVPGKYVGPTGTYPAPKIAKLLDYLKENVDPKVFRECLAILEIKTLEVHRTTEMTQDPLLRATTITREEMEELQLAHMKELFAKAEIPPTPVEFPAKDVTGVTYGEGEKGEGEEGRTREGVTSLNELVPKERVPSKEGGILVSGKTKEELEFEKMQKKLKGEK